MSDSAWFQKWFGEEYLSLYPHRDHGEAVQGVDLLLSRVPWSQGSEVLDLGCGAGRHLQTLHDRGLRATGLDLSSVLLLRARRASAALPLVRGDMRHLPFADAAFRIVTSFFTSFGYFAREEDDRHVLEEVRRCLRPGGSFFLDYLNAEQVVATLEPREVRKMGGRTVTQERAVLEGGRIVEKRIRIEAEPEAPADADRKRFVERVRLYPPAELESLLEGAGLIPTHLFGDYDGSPLRPSSPRCILLGVAS